MKLSTVIFDLIVYGLIATLIWFPSFSLPILTFVAIWLHVIGVAIMAVLSLYLDNACKEKFQEFVEGSKDPDKLPMFFMSQRKFYQRFTSAFEVALYFCLMQAYEYSVQTVAIFTLFVLGTLINMTKAKNIIEKFTYVLPGAKS